MLQSFYSKNGLDFLSFQRPGTSWGQALGEEEEQKKFNSSHSSGFGASRTSGFFDPNGAKVLKPALILDQRKSKPTKNSLALLWFTRAEKVLAQASHCKSVLEFLSFATSSVDRLVNQYKKQLKNDENLKQLSSSRELIRQITAFSELYQAYQIDYDIFSPDTGLHFATFMESFEQQIADFDTKMT